MLGALSPLGSADLDTVRATHQRLHEALAPWTAGRCLNFLHGENATAEQVRTAYDPDDYRRLTDLKAAYDPTNLFRHNHNVPPATRHLAGSPP